MSAMHIKRLLALACLLAACAPAAGPVAALAGVAAGADGVHIEVHHCPEEALSDGPQALLPEQYSQLAEQIKSMAELLGREIG